MASINIVAYEEDANLRHVSWNQRFLENVKRRYKLSHSQAVLYRNVAQDRWRMVACFYGLAVLVLPPVDKEARLSLDLEISRFLRRFSQNFERGMDKINKSIEATQSKLNQSKLKKKGNKKK